MLEENQLIDTGDQSVIVRDFADLLQELGVTGEEVIKAYTAQEELSHSLFREWGLQAVSKIAAKMPDLDSKVAMLREMLGMFQGHGSAQPQEEVKVEGEDEEEEGLHLRIIESAKDMLSEYLVKKESFAQKMEAEEKEEQINAEKLEELRQSNDKQL